MFSIRCNNCFKKHRNSFELNSCHHVICDKCKSKPPNDNKCPICKRSSKGIAITHDMPSNVASYFQDPDVYLEMYESISKFQNDQRDLCYKQFLKVQKSVSIKMEKLQGYSKLETHLSQQVDKEKKRIAEYTNYVNYYDQCDGDVSSSSSDVSGIKRGMSRPRTPSFGDTSDNDDDDNDLLRELKEWVKSKETNSSQPTRSQKKRKGCKIKSVKDFGI